MCRMRWSLGVSIAVGAVAAIRLSAMAPQPAGAYAIQRVAEGVYAAVPTRPMGLLPQATNLFIVNDDDVVVVDTGASPALTRDALEALRALTPKPVSAVINTHRHDDHIFGNAVYKAAFPDAAFIAHADVADGIMAQRGQRTRTSGDIGLDQIVQMIATGRGLIGEPLTPQSRRGLLADVAQLQSYGEDVTADQLRPTVSITEPLTLSRGARTIEIRPIGPAHCRGDVIVYLPKDRVLAIGDLAGLPFPVVDGQASDLARWPRAIDTVLGLDAAVIVAGHGGTIPRSVVEMERDLLRSIASQAVAGADQGQSLAGTMAHLEVRTFRSALAGSDPFLDLLFENQFLTAAVRAARRVR